MLQSLPELPPDSHPRVPASGKQGPFGCPGENETELLSLRFFPAWPARWDRLHVASGAAALRCGNLHHGCSELRSSAVAVGPIGNAFSAALRTSKHKSIFPRRTHTPHSQFIRASFDCLALFARSPTPLSPANEISHKSICTGGCCSSSIKVSGGLIPGLNQTTTTSVSQKTSR